MPIIARINTKMNDIYNIELFTIKSIDRINNSIIITDESDQIIILAEMFQTLFYIALRITVHKSKGSTLIVAIPCMSLINSIKG